MAFQVLVCGDRRWTDQRTINAVLDEWKAKYADMEIIEGEARGADAMARIWAESRGVAFHSYPADWTVYGRAAGPIRNRQMLSASPDVVLAFHNDIDSSKGTADMVRIARKAGVPTYVFRSSGD